MTFHKKLGHLSLASLSSLVQCLYVRPGAYPSETPFRCPTLRQAPGLTHKQQTSLERLATDKHSSLLRTFVNYVRKKFYNIGHRMSVKSGSVSDHPTEDPSIKIVKVLLLGTGESGKSTIVKQVHYFDLFFCLVMIYIDVGYLLL